MDKLNYLVEMAEKADAVANLMDAVNPHDILAIAEAFRELERRAEAAEAEAKHQLGVNVVLSRHNQAIVDQRDKALTQLSELARQEPDYFLNRIESSDKWVPETDLRIYESQLGASKSQDDHGGGIIELFTRPAPAAVPVVPDYFNRLVIAAKERAEIAMRKFPQPNYVLNKVAEENGEVIKAVIHYTEGREDWLSVEGELIDNLAMLIRLVTEGDGVIGFSPPEEVLRRIEGRKC